MSETKWALGPWEFHPESGIVTSGDKRTILDIDYSGISEDQSDATAVLIAAAPELYEALEKTREYCNLLADAIEGSDSLGDVAYRMHSHRDVGITARALSISALAKARGEA